MKKKNNLIKKIKFLALKVVIVKIPAQWIIFFWKCFNTIFQNQNRKKCFLLCTTGKNQEYFENGLLVTIKSIRLTNPGIPIVVFFSSLSESQKSKLEGCKLIEIFEERWSSEHRPDLTDAAFYRLQLGLLEEYDKVLYVDSDMVVLDSLDEIFCMPGNLIAVGEIKSLTSDIRDPRKFFDLEGFHKGNYAGFNTGFLCLNRKYWNGRLLEEAIKIGETYSWENLKNPVNAILNLLAYQQDGFTCVTHHYNFRAWTDCLKVESNMKGFLAPYIDSGFVKILHFTGPFKPWLYEKEYNSYPKLQRFMDMYLPCYKQFEP